MAITKRTAKIANPRKAPRTPRQLDQQTATIDTQAVNTNNQEITGEATPPRDFEVPLPEGFSGKIPSRATPATLTTTGEERETLLDNKLGLVDRSDAMKARLGKDGKGSGGRLQDSIKTDDIPGFDQGFDQKPKGEGLQVTVDNAGNTPMDPFRGGSVGGQLGDLAAAGTQSPGAGQKSKDLISTWRHMRRAGETTGPRHGDPDLPVRTLRPEGARRIEIFSDGSAIILEKDQTETQLPPGSVPIRPPAKPKPKTDEKDADTATPAGGGVGIPDPDTQGIKVNIVTGTLLEQLQVAQTGKPTSQGGGGDATPVEDGGIGGVVRDGFIAPNQSSINGRNLFGQPGGNGIGENVSGGNKGLNDPGRSNGAGVVNPGPEGGNPAGDPRFAEDPGDALGDGKPGLSFPPSPSSGDKETDPITGSTVAKSGGLVIADGFRPRTFDGITAFQASQPQPAPASVPTIPHELALPQPTEIFSAAPLIAGPVVVPPDQSSRNTPFGEPVQASGFGPSAFLQTAHTTSTLLLA